MQLLGLLTTFTILLPNWALAAPQCESLFSETALATQDLQIQVLKKKQTEAFFDKVKDKSIEKEVYKEVEATLKKIKDHGTSELTESEKELLIDFRQDISFLRSSYEILTDKHESPKKFDKFVKRFGKLKDLSIMKDNQQSKEMAKSILESVSFKKLDSMLKETDLANADSVRMYLEDRVGFIRHYITINRPTVEELHTARKAIRNIYRYLEIQKKVIKLSADQSEILKKNLKHLKSLNKDIGLICDSHAGLILSGEIKKTTVYHLPPELLERLKDFTYKVTIKGSEVSL